MSLYFYIVLFNSPEFLLFLPIVFGLYWFVVQRNLRAQNMLLVIASYVFYGWWDWRFLGLITFERNRAKSPHSIKAKYFVLNA